MSPTAQPACALCEGDGGILVFRAPLWRLVRTEEGGFPAFYRVIWNAHVQEFSDLPHAQRHLCIDVVTEVEQTLRLHLQPDKLNLASLGNVVPHLHWHVIARWRSDSHFPAPVWAAAQRAADAGLAARVAGRLPALEADLATRLAAM